MFKRHLGEKLLQADIMIRIIADFPSESMQASDDVVIPLKYSEKKMN